MATAIIGRLSEFDASEELVSSYVERAQLFFEANNIEDGKKVTVAVFLSAVGAKTYALLRSLVAPKLPKEKKFDEIVELLKQHFEPKPLVIAERYHFHRRNQATEESIAEFIAELRRLSTHCQFGSFLDEALRDRFVCGLRSESIVKKLVTEADLLLKRALEIAQGMEAAAENARKLQRPKDAATPAQDLGGQSNVNKVTTSSHKTTSQCYRRGRSNHEPPRCPFKTTKCFNCGKIGHIKSACRQPPRTPQTRRGQAIQVIQQDSDSETEPIYTVN